MTEGERRRLLLDEMLSGAIAAQLRDRGLDVIAVVDDVSLVSTPDEDLLAYAAEQCRVLVTANISDFTIIANEWRTARRTHHGLIYMANRRFPQNRSLIGRITDALASLCASNAFPPPDAEVFLSRERR